MANLYLNEGLSRDDMAPGAVLQVTGEEARHAVRVSRLRVGESTRVGNGKGVIAHGTVQDAGREHFSLRVDHVETVERREPRCVLVQALAKGDRDERAIEQATEFGIDEIIPWEAERSVSRWGSAKAERGAEKWRRIVREAAKQSLRAWVPEVGVPVSLNGLADLATRGTLLVMHPAAHQRLSDWVRHEDLAQTEQLIVVVGPEGGLSDAELEALRRAGAHTLALGSEVLRTSSAGPAALAVLNVALRRW